MKSRVNQYSNVLMNGFANFLKRFTNSFRSDYGPPNKRLAPSAQSLASRSSRRLTPPRFNLSLGGKCLRADEPTRVRVGRSHQVANIVGSRNGQPPRFWPALWLRVRIRSLPSAFWMACGSVPQTELTFTASSTPKALCSKTISSLTVPSNQQLI